MPHSSSDSGGSKARASKTNSNLLRPVSTSSLSETRSGRVYDLVCDKLCCKDRCVPLDKSSLFFVQALVVWSVLSLPGNIVTFVLYQKVMSQAAMANATDLETVRKIQIQISCSC